MIQSIKTDLCFPLGLRLQDFSFPFVSSLLPAPALFLFWIKQKDFDSSFLFRFLS